MLHFLGVNKCKVMKVRSFSVYSDWYWTAASLFVLFVIAVLLVLHVAYRSSCVVRVLQVVVIDKVFCTFDNFS